MKQRNGIIDLSKFIAALIIMEHHRSILGNYQFKDGWIFVEFFAMITGYLTMKHFATFKEENIPKQCFYYMCKKFLPLMPLVIGTVLFQWLLFGIVQVANRVWGVKDFIFMVIEELPLEMVLLPKFSVCGGTPFVASLWYLTSIIMVFPLFLTIVTIKNKYARILICFVYSVSYYGIIGIKDIIEFPQSSLRLLAALALGLIIFEINSDVKLPDINNMFLTISGIMMFVLSIVTTYRNIKAYKFNLLCFIIFLMIMFSTNGLGIFNNKVVYYLGTLSMPLYIVHFAVGTAIAYFGNVISNIGILLMYYIISITVSILALMLVNRSGFNDKFLKYNHDYKDV